MILITKLPRKNLLDWAQCIEMYNQKLFSYWNAMSVAKKILALLCFLLQSTQCLCRSRWQCNGHSNGSAAR